MPLSESKKSVVEVVSTKKRLTLTQTMSAPNNASLLSGVVGGGAGLPSAAAAAATQIPLINSQLSTPVALLLAKSEHANFIGMSVQANLNSLNNSTSANNANNAGANMNNAALMNHQASISLSSSFVSENDFNKRLLSRFGCYLIVSSIDPVKVGETVSVHIN